MLKAIGMWILKIILGGVYGRVVADDENRAEATRASSVHYADGVREAAKTEIAIIRQQSEAEKIFKPPAAPGDPFKTDLWNSRP